MESRKGEVANHEKASKFLNRLVLKMNIFRYLSITLLGPFDAGEYFLHLSVGEYLLHLPVGEYFLHLPVGDVVELNDVEVEFVERRRHLLLYNWKFRGKRFVCVPQLVFVSTNAGFFFDSTTRGSLEIPARNKTSLKPTYFKADTCAELDKKFKHFEHLWVFLRICGYF